jgi:hypothetical protein
MSDDSTSKISEYFVKLNEIFHFTNKLIG